MHDIATDSGSCDKKATHQTEIEKFIAMLSPNSALLPLPNEIDRDSRQMNWSVCFNPFRPWTHLNAFGYNNSWLGFYKNKKIWIVYQEKEKFSAKMSPHLSQLNVVMAHRNYFRRNNLWILKLATYTKIEDHYSGCKLATF